MRLEAEIKECVHYCGFRYGRNEYHPYESYVLKLHQGVDQADIRFEFENFLKWYRPKDFGQALGVKLDRRYPLWLFPWSRAWKFIMPKLNAGWCVSKKDIPDIITHFSEEGIPKCMVEQEIKWLDGTYKSIADQGYLPDKYGCPRGKLMLGKGGQRAILIVDGNHRISALSALKYSSLQIIYARWNVIDINALETWHGVRSGFFSKDDAERIFLAYFNGNHNYIMGDGDVAIVN